MIFIRSEAMTEVNGVKGNSRWLTVQEKLWAPACRVGKSWGISIWLTIRIAIWPHQGRGTSAELVRRGLEFGHGSSEFVVKTWGGFPYWRTVINP